VHFRASTPESRGAFEERYLQVVFIFGPTASGKLTIASEVASMTGFRLFPDHLAVDLVKGVFDYGMRAFTRIREWAWIEVLREAVHANRSPRLHVQAAGRDPQFVHLACLRHHRATRRQVVFVELTCPEETIEARVENADRRDIGKLSSLAEYRRLRDQGGSSSARCRHPR
jgi:hypothetical protein